eukprot:Tbor_TRINITY_DN5874_c0_g1::TRINITY_DN5874_c0_g1_i1::g.6934::m.6934
MSSNVPYSTEQEEKKSVLNDFCENVLSFYTPSSLRAFPATGICKDQGDVKKYPQTSQHNGSSACEEAPDECREVKSVQCRYIERDSCLLHQMEIAYALRQGDATGTKKDTQARFLDGVAACQQYLWKYAYHPVDVFAIDDTRLKERGANIGYDNTTVQYRLRGSKRGISINQCSVALTGDTVLSKVDYNTTLVGSPRVSETERKINKSLINGIKHHLYRPTLSNVVVNSMPVTPPYYQSNWLEPSSVTQGGAGNRERYTVTTQRVNIDITSKQTYEPTQAPGTKAGNSCHYGTLSGDDIHNNLMEEYKVEAEGKPMCGRHLHASLNEYSSSSFSIDNKFRNYSSIFDIYSFTNKVYGYINCPIRGSACFPYIQLNVFALRDFLGQCETSVSDIYTRTREQQSLSTTSFLVPKIWSLQGVAGCTNRVCHLKLRKYPTPMGEGQTYHNDRKGLYNSLLSLFESATTTCYKLSTQPIKASVLKVNTNDKRENLKSKCDEELLDVLEDPDYTLRSKRSIEYDCSQVIDKPPPPASVNGTISQESDIIDKRPSLQLYSHHPLSINNTEPLGTYQDTIVGVSCNPWHLPRWSVEVYGRHVQRLKRESIQSLTGGVKLEYQQKGALFLQDYGYNSFRSLNENDADERSGGIMRATQSIVRSTIGLVQQYCFGDYKTHSSRKDSVPTWIYATQQFKVTIDVIQRCVTSLVYLHLPGVMLIPCSPLQPHRGIISSNSITNNNSKVAYDKCKQWLRETSTVDVDFRAVLGLKGRGAGKVGALYYGYIGDSVLVTSHERLQHQTYLESIEAPHDTVRGLGFSPQTSGDVSVVPITPTKSILPPSRRVCPDKGGHHILYGFIAGSLEVSKSVWMHVKVLLFVNWHHVVHVEASSKTNTTHSSACKSNNENVASIGYALLLRDGSRGLKYSTKYQELVPTRVECFWSFLNSRRYDISTGESNGVWTREPTASDLPPGGVFSRTVKCGVVWSYIDDDNDT